MSSKGDSGTLAAIATTYGVKPWYMIVTKVVCDVSTPNRSTSEGGKRTRLCVQNSDCFVVVRSGMRTGRKEI
eukprot:scaffold279809_cov32-Prasinocladus_malaysianus.AAC.3